MDVIALQLLTSKRLDRAGTLKMSTFSNPMARGALRGVHLNGVFTHRHCCPLPLQAILQDFTRATNCHLPFLFLVFVGAVISPVCTHKRNARGRKIMFFPYAIMLATNLKALVSFTALFNNTRTLKFKAQPTNTFFAAVNQVFGGSSQLTNTAELCRTLFVVWQLCTAISSSRARQQSKAGRSRRTFDWR